MDYDKKFNELRVKAEEKIGEKYRESINGERASLEKLIHELNVHQIELEMQNDELRKLYQDLVESKNMFFKLYDNAPVAYLVVNHKGQIGMTNKKFLEIIGKENADVKSKYISDFVYYEDIDTFYSVFKTFYNHPSRTDFQLRLNGSEGVVSVDLFGYQFDNYVRVYNDLNDYNFLLVMNDVTKEKRLENELENKNKALFEMNTTLQEKVEDETRRRLQNEQILFEQKKFIDMGQMINSIAHQWRQPLNNMHLVMQMLQDQWSGRDLGQNEDDLFRMHSEMVQFMSKTIDDFRNFFSTSKLTQEFNITRVMIDTITLISAQLKHYDIPVKIICSCSEKSFECDLDSLNKYCSRNNDIVYGYIGEFQQIVLNLLSNAKDAVLEYQTEFPGKGYITAGIELLDSTVIMKVDNEGYQIKEDLFSKIFEPYFTTKEEGAGTGIGLYMTKVIVENNLFGKIDVENTDNGVSFIVTLPRKFGE